MSGDREEEEAKTVAVAKVLFLVFPTAQFVDCVFPEPYFAEHTRAILGQKQAERHSG